MSFVAVANDVVSVGNTTTIRAGCDFSTEFVCYHAAGCAENNTRPVFVLGSSLEDCCGKPSVVAAQDITTEACSDCGKSSTSLMLPLYIAILSSTA